MARIRFVLRVRLDRQQFGLASTLPLPVSALSPPLAPPGRAAPLDQSVSIAAMHDAGHGGSTSRARPDLGSCARELRRCRCVSPLSRQNSYAHHGTRASIRALIGHRQRRGSADKSQM